MKHQTKTRIPVGKDFRVQMTDKERDELLNLMTKHGITERSEFFRLMLQTMQSVNKSTQPTQPSFDDKPMPDYDGLSEQQIVDKAIEKVGVDFLTRSGIVAEAKKMYRGEQTLTAQGKPRQRASNGDVFKQIDNLVKERMRLNNEATDWTEKRNINTAWVQKGGKEDEFGRSLGESYFAFSTVKKYFDIHGEEIAKHHNQLEITPTHNMRVPKALKKLASQKKGNNG